MEKIDDLDVEIEREMSLEDALMHTHLDQPRFVAASERPRSRRQRHRLHAMDWGILGQRELIREGDGLTRSIRDEVEYAPFVIRLPCRIASRRHLGIGRVRHAPAVVFDRAHAGVARLS